MAIRASILRNTGASSGPSWAFCCYGVEYARDGAEDFSIGYDIPEANIPVAGQLLVMAFPLTKIGVVIPPPAPVPITAFPQYTKPVWSG